VTFHLADSLTAETKERIERSLSVLPPDIRAMERRKRLQEWVDAGHGSCVLRHPEMARMVQETLLHFHGVRYHLHAWVVMPNHVHALCEPTDGWELAKIVASWKKYAARAIRMHERGSEDANQEIGVPRKTRAVWHREYWDRYIRNEEHYRRAREYIHENPVKAGLVVQARDWPWSSAGRPPLVDPTPGADDWV
jgi:type I restriction enzyme R subunit/putative DNA methylase